MIALRVIVIVLSVVQIKAKGEECNLPDNGGQSTCVRFHLCDSLYNIIKKYGNNPPQEQATFIRKHACKGNYVCCPPNEPPLDLSSRLPDKSDLSKVTAHRNINLVNSRTCGTSVADRIIGGQIAKLGEFPWMALLRYDVDGRGILKNYCGGTLISSFFVLTAAHCIRDDLVEVRLGEHQISTVEDCDIDDFCMDPVQDFSIAKIIRHENYNQRKKVNDVALIKLSKAADVTKSNVRTICLPLEEINQLESIDQETKESLLISGWGLVEGGMKSDVLMKAAVPLLENTACAQRFSAADNIKVYPTYICAGGRTKVDTCSGDSGGPIQAFASVNERPRMVLYGVVSAGIECLNPNTIYPGFYTNIRNYLTWILDNMS